MMLVTTTAGDVVAVVDDRDHDGATSAMLTYRSNVDESARFITCKRAAWPALTDDERRQAWAAQTSFGAMMRRFQQGAMS